MLNKNSDFAGGFEPVSELISEFGPCSKKKTLLKKLKMVQSIYLPPSGQSVHLLPWRTVRNESRSRHRCFSTEILDMDRLALILSTKT